MWKLVYKDTIRFVGYKTSFMIREDEDIKGKINILSKSIIIHSLIYYIYNTSIIKDYEFDMNAKQLFNLIESHNDIFINSKYYYVLYDFDGCSGFNIPDRLSNDDRCYFDSIINRLGIN